VRHLALRAAITTIAVATAVTGGTGVAADATISQAVNDTPRLGPLTARIGRVYDEAEARFRAGGLGLRFRLCDDGPQSTRLRTGLIRLDHRWGDRSRTWFAAQELAPLITWDVRFRTRECVRSVPWSSTLPADLPQLRGYPCYTVRVRVRDPGGRWSNMARAEVKKCS
jgi:hypothetical protein